MIHNFNNDLQELPDMSGMTPEEQEEAHVTAALFGCAIFVAAILIASVVCLLLGGCSTPKTVTVVEMRDSIGTQVVTNTVYVPDTQYVTLPPQIVERTTPDTTSTLRTQFAESTATFSGGLLRHVLRNLEQPIPVPVQHRETTHDSTVYREKEVPVPVPVVKEVPARLNWHQQARLWLANLVLVAIAVCAGVWVIRKRTWWLRLLKK